MIYCPHPIGNEVGYGYSGVALLPDGGARRELFTGCALTLDHLVNAMDMNGLCFRPLAPALDVGLNLVWKKYQLFSPATEAFLRKVQQVFAVKA